MPSPNFPHPAPPFAKGGAPLSNSGEGFCVVTPSSPPAGGLGRRLAGKIKNTPGLNGGVLLYEKSRSAVPLLLL